MKLCNLCMSDISMILKFEFRQQLENKSRSKLSSYYHFKYNFCYWDILFNIALHILNYSTETCTFCYPEVVWKLFCYVNGIILYLSHLLCNTHIL